MLKVYNLRSPRSGKQVINQVVTEVGNLQIFSSYGSNIAFTKDDMLYLNERYVNFSRTTSKYLNIFVKDIAIFNQTVTLDSDRFDIYLGRDLEC